MGNEVLQFAKMKAAGQRDLLPSVDYVSQFRPDNYEFGMPDYQFGSGYGRAAGQMLSDVMSGGSFSDPRYGLSQSGQEQYQAMLDDYKQYAVDNADFFVQNRSNPQLIANRYVEDATKRGILPSGGASLGDYAAGGMEAVKEFFSGESKGELTEIGDTPDFQKNMIAGLRQQISENPAAFVEGIKAPVMKQYMSNRFGDFGGFLSNLMRDMGQGSGNIFKYLMDLLGKVSPSFQKMVSNISSRVSPESGDATAGANA